MKNKRRYGQRLRSVTRIIFVTTQISALIWVFMSYAIAIYAVLCLGQVYTMAELSEPAIHTILGVGTLKVLENVFEHNNGPIFGHSEGGECGTADHSADGSAVGQVSDDGDPDHRLCD